MGEDYAVSSIKMMKLQLEIYRKEIESLRRLIRRVENGVYGYLYQKQQDAILTLPIIRDTLQHTLITDIGKLKIKMAIMEESQQRIETKIDTIQLYITDHDRLLLKLFNKSAVDWTDNFKLKNKEIAESTYWTRFYERNKEKLNGDDVNGKKR